jgi:hypothetical protein
MHFLVLLVTFSLKECILIKTISRKENNKNVNEEARTINEALTISIQKRTPS